MQPFLQCLSQHEACLCLRAIVGIYEEQDAVDHAHDAFDFSSKVSVAGSVDDVDRRPLPMHGGVFGLDGDALFLLEVHGVHGSFLDLLVLAEGSALFKEFVDEGGFPMVDVGDDGDVTDRN